MSLWFYDGGEIRPLPADADIHLPDERVCSDCGSLNDVRWADWKVPGGDGDENSDLLCADCRAELDEMRGYTTYWRPPADETHKCRVPDTNVRGGDLWGCACGQWWEYRTKLPMGWGRIGRRTATRRIRKYGYTAEVEAAHFSGPMYE